MEAASPGFYVVMPSIHCLDSAWHKKPSTYLHDIDNPPRECHACLSFGGAEGFSHPLSRILWCRMHILRGNWFWVFYFSLLPILLSIYESVIVVRLHIDPNTEHLRLY